ncbi:hypothetical protein pb186bvf_017552 [Paramecium bursaria]
MRPSQQIKKSFDEEDFNQQRIVKKQQILKKFSNKHQTQAPYNQELVCKILSKHLSPKIQTQSKRQVEEKDHSFLLVSHLRDIDVEYFHLKLREFDDEITTLYKETLHQFLQQKGQTEKKQVTQKKQTQFQDRARIHPPIFSDSESDSEQVQETKKLPTLIDTKEDEQKEIEMLIDESLKASSSQQEVDLSYENIKQQKHLRRLKKMQQKDETEQKQLEIKTQQARKNEDNQVIQYLVCTFNQQELKEELDIRKAVRLQGFNIIVQ